LEEGNTFHSRMRMSPQQAKPFAVILLRAIRGYERQYKINIEIPKEVLDELKIPVEDWKQFIEPPAEEK